MALPKGTRLGQYEIRDLIGKGGMGEVYRAWDSKLERDVALKLLPEIFARDPERVARFKREAKLLASLNHTNIATIHGLEESNGSHFLVMELVEGETLAELVRRGPVEIDEALRVCSQIAEALEHAHEKTIVHRDLKPANVKVTPEGKVKVLDFGLAKAFAAAGSENFAGSDSPTLSAMPPAMENASPTLPGVILGTAAYMSPEQAKGKTVDKRTDIWALGAVLFELLTAKRAFDGESVPEILGSVFKAEPDWAALPAATPTSIRSLLRRCLRKDPQQRPKDAGDLHIEMDEARAAASPAASTVIVQAPAPGNKLRERLAWVATAILSVVAITLAVLYFRAPGTTDSSAIRFAITPPDEAATVGTMAAVSPDGTRVAFVTIDASGKAVLWVRSLDSPAAQSLPGTEGANSNLIFWSPDSRYIGFVAGGKLKTIPVASGPVQVLADAVARGGAWGRDGSILFTPSTFGGLAHVPASGGNTTPVTKLDPSRGERAHRWPQFLPDGRHFLYHVLGAPAENSGVYVGSLDSTETKRLLVNDYQAAYAPPGYLLFVQGRSLMAQSFNATSLELSGAPSFIADGLSLQQTTGSAGYTVSDRGVLAYSSSGNEGNTKLLWFDRTGKQLGMVDLPGLSTGPELSPDEKRVALAVGGSTQTNDIWVLDLERGIPTRFTSDAGNDRFPRWSPDGNRLLFQSNRSAALYNFYQKSLSGAENEQLLFESADSKYPFDVSRDGRFLVYAGFGTEGAATADLWALPLSGDKKPVPFLRTKFQETQARFSPDGKWMAYVSTESGTDEVYVASFPGADRKVRISTNGGVQPRWRRDGKELFYLSADRKMVAVSVSGESALQAGTAARLFEVRFSPRGSIAPQAFYQYDVTADGQRFLVNAPVENPTVPITVVLNWTASLKK